jgi:hypothetical protein
MNKLWPNHNITVHFSLMRVDILYLRARRWALFGHIQFGHIPFAHRKATHSGT